MVFTEVVWWLSPKWFCWWGLVVIVAVADDDVDDVGVGVAVVFAVVVVLVDGGLVAIVIY